MERLSKLSIPGVLFAAVFLAFLWAQPLRAQQDSAYTVVPGDTLGAIAARFGVTIDALVAANGIEDPDRIRVGQVLLIPGADGLMPAAAPSAAEIPTAVVRAQAGDDIATLAARYGEEPTLVAELNAATPTRRLFPGQPVRVPSRSVPPPPSLGLGAILSIDAPDSIVQGRTGRLYVTTSRPVALFGRWTDQTLHFHALDEQGLLQFAFIPVNALLEPGMYSLEVGYITRQGVELKRTFPVNVVAGPYDYQEIVVAQEKADVLTPEVVSAERERVIEVWSHYTPALLWRERFRRPISADYPTTSPFGTRRTYSVADIGNFHAGQDFGAPEGALIFAPAPGIVVLAEPLAVRGNAVILDHGGGVFTGYWHMSEIKVAPGMTVETGDVLGLVGNTGLSTGPHLHWELRIDGVAVDPMQFLDEPPFEIQE
jgi:murein DD-endopeptidase MepM/ murein hydrolase activator NlpD